MNQFIKAIKALDTPAVTGMLDKKTLWANRQEEDGKNALHYLCGVPVAERPESTSASLSLLKVLLAAGMDINSIHSIADRSCIFPATPLWYAYTRGRNETLYPYLLEQGAH